jgi:elongation factor G
VIKAQAPLAEILLYASDLRSITSGRGSYIMELSHYEEVPSLISEKIISASARKEEEEEE